MDLNAEFTTDVAALHGTLGDLLTAYKTSVQLGKDLQAAIDSGADRSLTAEQAAIFKADFDGMQQEIRDALTAAVTNPEVIPRASGSADPTAIDPTRNPNAPPTQSRVNG